MKKRTTYPQLQPEERMTIASMKQQGSSVRAMAQYCSLHDHFGDDPLIQWLGSPPDPEIRHLSFHAAGIALAAALHRAAAGEFAQQTLFPALPLLRGE
jgi:hypothetical protein